MVTFRNFRDSYPEFIDAPDELVNGAIARAGRLCPAGVWGQYADDGVMLTAARYIALSPWGRDLKLVQDNNATVYDADLEQLKQIVACYGARVV